MAQRFLDRFVRQNIAEIDEIRSEEIPVDIQLRPAERAIYLELDHYLQVRPRAMQTTQNGRVCSQTVPVMCQTAKSLLHCPTPFPHCAKPFPHCAKPFLHCPKPF